MAQREKIRRLPDQNGQLNTTGTRDDQMRRTKITIWKLVIETLIYGTGYPAVVR
jgi:hypothetical protein